MKKVGILYHPKVASTRTKAEELKSFLDTRGLPVWTCSAWDQEEARSRLADTDLILTVGGDGTILRAAQIAFPEGVPITGINLGKLGFLTEFNADEAIDKLPLLYDGQGWIDERTMLQVEIADSSRRPEVYHALNDIVIARGAMARVIRVETAIDGQPFTTYKADGVIMATATGSTGYALAAGGPVLHPHSADFLMLPIAPHLSCSYVNVLPAGATVSWTIIAVHEATLSIDGIVNLPVVSGQSLIIKRSPHATRFLRIRPRDYFYSSLDERLKGNTR